MRRKIHTRKQCEAAVFEDLPYFLGFLASHYPNIPPYDRRDVVMNAVKGGLTTGRQAHYTAYHPDRALFRTWFCTWLRSVAGQWTAGAIKQAQAERCLLEAWVTEQLHQDGDNFLSKEPFQRAVYNMMRLRQAIDRRLPRDLIDPRHTAPEPVHMLPADLYHELARVAWRNRGLSITRENFHALSFQQRLQGVRAPMHEDLVAMSVDHWVETIDVISRFLTFTVAIMHELNAQELDMSPACASRLTQPLAEVVAVIEQWAQEGIITKGDV